MAATPPAQIMASPETPLTPLHGASYDHEDSPRRSSARLRQKHALHDIASQQSSTQPSIGTPKLKNTSSCSPPSPNRTPQRKPATHRVRLMSPPSPDFNLSAPSRAKPHPAQQQSLLSATTTFNEGMLPTPVKTPNKKQKLSNSSTAAARALFQDPLLAGEMPQSSHRNRKPKRYNGFSLESFSAEDGVGSNSIQIFTDSRDQIPQQDIDEENPFIDNSKGETVTSKKVSGTAKRRKISAAKPLDPQVETSLKNDEGIVYVFRGRKVYRRFDDAGEEEEEIDPADLGLLQGDLDAAQTIKSFRTLTRKSIKPTRLFQTEEQKRTRELEKKEEEATTDVEDAASEQQQSGVKLSITNKSIRDKKGKGKAVESTINNDETVRDNRKGKKGSPFDSWARVKPGSASSASSNRASKGRKRAASPTSNQEGVSTQA